MSLPDTHRLEQPKLRPFELPAAGAFRGTVLLDFDGVICTYAGWKGPEPSGELIAGVREAIRLLVARGHVVSIFSTRPAWAIRDWMAARAPSALALITDIIDNKPMYVAFFDDRAHHIVPNQANSLLESVRSRSLALIDGVLS